MTKLSLLKVRDAIIQGLNFHQQRYWRAINNHGAPILSLTWSSQLHYNQLQKLHLVRESREIPPKGKFYEIVPPEEFDLPMRLKKKVREDIHRHKEYQVSVHLRVVQKISEQHRRLYYKMVEEGRAIPANPQYRRAYQRFVKWGIALEIEPNVFTLHPDITESFDANSMDAKMRKWAQTGMKYKEEEAPAPFERVKAQYTNKTREQLMDELLNTPI